MDNKEMITLIFAVILTAERNVSMETAIELLDKYYWSGEYKFTNPLLIDKAN